MPNWASVCWRLPDTGDDGQPKTGRRYYYLALSHGYIQPDMSATEAAQKSRKAAYNRVTKVLGVLRMSWQLDWEMVLDLNASWSNGRPTARHARRVRICAEATTRTAGWASVSFRLCWSRRIPSNP